MSSSDARARSSGARLPTARANQPFRKAYRMSPPGLGGPRLGHHPRVKQIDGRQVVERGPTPLRHAVPEGATDVARLGCCVPPRDECRHGNAAKQRRRRSRAPRRVLPPTTRQSARRTPALRQVAAQDAVAGVEVQLRQPVGDRGQQRLHAATARCRAAPASARQASAPASTAPRQPADRAVIPPAEREPSRVGAATGASAAAGAVQLRRGRPRGLPPAQPSGYTGGAPPIRKGVEGGRRAPTPPRGR